MMATGDNQDRRESISQRSAASQTAADFIRDQMQLEADAREALPYSIEDCTKHLGSLRQNVFACLTCNPPPTDSNADYNAAGVCYACSVQCHGEHDLVEIFQKRNFTCDCGTTRFSSQQPCTLRINADTNTKGNVHSEAADPRNEYNPNFRNRFCSCSIDYKPHEQKGTMFQCLGLGTYKSGGCGEDWYHPGCLMGLGPRWYETMEGKLSTQDQGPSESKIGSTPIVVKDVAPQTGGGISVAAESDVDGDNDAPLPKGFPSEDDFEHLICYKCVEAIPWIKRYASSPGFLPAVFYRKAAIDSELQTGTAVDPPAESSNKKRKLDTVGDADTRDIAQAKRTKSEETDRAPATDGLSAGEGLPVKIKDEDSKENLPDIPEASCQLLALPPSPLGEFSLFVKDGFRERFCRCASCFPHLKSQPQLLEEEEAYEPPLSDDGGGGSDDGGSTHGSGSLYERGESALRNVDRVRAIEGVMAYNHLKDQLKPFFQRFAESGEAISADDIKEYFAKLRGDQEAIREAGDSAKQEDNRREESGH